MMTPRHRTILGPFALVLGLVLACGADEASIPPTAPAADQEEALRLATKVDLPALAQADRVAIEAGARRVVVTRPESLAALQKALTPRLVPPSGGLTAYELSFSRGATPVRTVWVYASGEWGFQRPEGPSWTIGANPALARLVARALAPPE